MTGSDRSRIDCRRLARRHPAGFSARDCSRPSTSPPPSSASARAFRARTRRRCRRTCPSPTCAPRTDVSTPSATGPASPHSRTPSARPRRALRQGRPQNRCRARCAGTPRALSRPGARPRPSLPVTASVRSSSCHLPQNPLVTSRVTRDLSSCVLTRHIMVSCTVSGSSCRSRTSRPTSAAAQSSVSATPGTLRSSSFRMPSTIRAICSDSEAEAPSMRAMMMRASRSTSG